MQRRAVSVVSRSILPPWGSIRLRLALHTYAPWGVRVMSQTKSRKIPSRKILLLFFASRYSHGYGDCTAYAGTCYNGNLRPLSQRTADNQCGSCSNGYRLSGTTCVRLNGLCPNGRPKPPSQTTRDNECETCYNGYKLLGYSCVDMNGRCQNGYPVAKNQATEDWHCGNCNTGFGLSNRRCTACTLHQYDAPDRLGVRVCTDFAGDCPGGDLKPLTKRRANNECGSCKPGFLLFSSGLAPYCKNFCESGNTVFSRPEVTEVPVLAVSIAGTNTALARSRSRQARAARRQAATRHKEGFIPFSCPVADALATELEGSVSQAIVERADVAASSISHTLCAFPCTVPGEGAITCVAHFNAFEVTPVKASRIRDAVRGAPTLRLAFGGSEYNAPMSTDVYAVKMTTSTTTRTTTSSSSTTSTSTSSSTTNSCNGVQEPVICRHLIPLCSSGAKVATQERGHIDLVEIHCPKACGTCSTTTTSTPTSSSSSTSTHSSTSTTSTASNPLYVAHVSICHHCVCLLH